MPESTSHTEAPAGKKPFPPFQTENFPSQLAWLAVSFVLLYVLMSKVALPRIGSILEERSRRIGDDLKSAHDLKQQSDAAHAAYEKSLADARTRAQAIAGEMRQRQLAEAEATNKRLEAQLHDKIAAAEQTITATRSAAMGNVRTIAAELASTIVQKFIGTKPADREIAAALSDAIKG